MPPISQKLAILVAIAVVAVAGLGYGIYATAAENDDIRTKIKAVQADIEGLDAIIATRAAKEKNKKDQEDVFKELVYILPQYSEKQEELVLNALTSHASYAKLKPKGVVPKAPSVPSPRGAAPTAAPPPPPPGPGAGASDFAQTELTMRFEGTFANFVKFLSLVENQESYMRVDSFQLSPMPLPEGIQPEHRELSITVKISTFHYVQK